MMNVQNSTQKNCAQYLLEEPDSKNQEQVRNLLEINTTSSTAELIDRMNHMITFGTAGLRAKMEAGYNRLNYVTVYRFSYALFQVLTKKLQREFHAVVGFDIRMHSREFALEVTRVLSLLGARVSMFEDYCPTPLCAFATKNLQADIGIMITASHNPWWDNGIKIFTSNSAQAGDDLTSQIEPAMIQAPTRDQFFDKNKTYPKDYLTGFIKQKIFENYLLDINKSCLFEKHEINLDTKIIYTPIHGVGNNFFPQAVKQAGFSGLNIVDEQALPDKLFSTVSYPNPEEEGCLDLAHKLATQKNINWVFAHDPDADRLQVSFQNIKLSGNEMGILLGYFCIQKYLNQNQTPLVATSIVSSTMLKKMAHDLGAMYIDAPTGFGNIIGATKNSNNLVFAYEEAIGFLIDQTVLDKDGIHAGVRFMEIVGLLEKRGLSPWDFLDELYLRFGLFYNTQWSIRFDSLMAEQRKIQAMNKFRSMNISHLAQLLGQAELKKYDLTQANVVIFENEPYFRLIIRPSGTEPKIKIYIENYRQVNNHTELALNKKLLKTLAQSQRGHIDHELS